jgi:type IV pilus assembly protein PilX
MNKNNQVRPKTANHVRTQGGLSLIVVLLFLIAITSVAVLSSRKAILQEGSGRNQLDTEVARQAAESALRDAERDLAGTVVDAANASCIRPEFWLFDVDCPTGLCRKETDSDAKSTYANSDWSAAKAGSTDKSEPWWPTSKGGLWNDKFDDKPPRTPTQTTKCNFTGAVPLGTFTGTAAIDGVAIQPEYLIEYFQKKKKGSQEVDTYRITARGFGYTRRTQVVLQTVFVTSDAD